MKTRPKRLLLLAGFLGAIAIAFPVQIMMLYGHTPLEIVAIFAKIAPLNWVIMLLAFSTAYFAYRASPWLITALPVLTVMVFYNNWFVAQVGSDFSHVTAGVASGSFLLIVGAMMTRESLSVILKSCRTVVVDSPA